MARSLEQSTGGVLCAVALGALAAACGGRPERPTPAPAPVHVTEPRTSGIRSTIRATGALQWSRESELSFPVSGTISRLLVDQGDRVRAGQTLAKLDTTVLRARAAQAEADLLRASQELGRYEKLLAAGFASAQRLEDLRAARIAAQSALEEARYNLAHATLASPMTGGVLARAAQSGEVVTAGEVVLTVADERSGLLLRVPVPEADAARIAVSAPAQVQLDRDGRLVGGRVIRVGRRAGAESGAVTVDIAIPASSDLRSGAVATAEIAAMSRAGDGGYMRVPAEAILAVNGRAGDVFVVDPTTLKARRVTVGFGGFEGDDALVSGLPPRARVITAGGAFLSDGQVVALAGQSTSRAGPVRP